MACRAARRDEAAAGDRVQAALGNVRCTLRENGGGVGYCFRTLRGWTSSPARRELPLR